MVRQGHVVEYLWDTRIEQNLGTQAKRRKEQQMSEAYWEWVDLAQNALH